MDYSLEGRCLSLLWVSACAGKDGKQNSGCGETADVRPEIVALVGGLFWGEPGVAGEQPARHNVINRLVYRLDADQPAGAEAKDREMAALRVAA